MANQTVSTITEVVEAYNKRCDRTLAVITDMEVTARELIEISRALDDNPKMVDRWSVRQSIRQVFRAMWCQALHVERVVDLARSIGGISFQAPVIQRELTAFVRFGLLRSRRMDGVLFYEINFPKDPS